MATYVVSTTGSDSAAGSLAAPFATFSKADSVMSAADLLYVRGGDYTETMDNLFPSGVSPSAKTRIVGYPGDTLPHISATAGNNWCMRVTGKADQSFERLHFHGPSAALDAVKLTDGGGGSANRIDLIDCEVHSGPNQGILMTGTGSGHTILRGEVSDSGASIPGFGHGIYVSVTDVIIDGTLIHDCVGHGIHAFGGDPSRLIVRNVKAYDNGDHGIGIYTGASMQVYNCIAWGNVGYSIRAAYSASSPTIYFNTCYSSAGIVVEATASGVTVANNICWWTSDGNFILRIDGAGNTATVQYNVARVIRDDSGGTATLSDNITGTDPTLVDAAGNDFHLLGTSPAIAAGINVGVTTDYDGLVRIMPPSIGAFDITNRGGGGSGGGGSPRGSRAYRRGFDPVVSRPIPRSNRTIVPVVGSPTPRGNPTWRRG